MDVTTNLYKAVLAKVIEDTTVKRFEWYSGELEQENIKDYALFYHSVYMELDPIPWESLGKRRQHGMCTFRLFICSPAVHGSGSNELPATQAAELAHLERCTGIFHKLHCFAPDADSGVGCISRSESNVRIKYPSLVLDILSFKVHLVDNGAMHLTVPLPDDIIDEISTQKFINTDTMIKAHYLDGFDAICGNAIKENTLLAYLKSRGVNTIYLYDLSTILADEDGYPILAAFIIKARTYGVMNVYGFRGSDTTLISTQVRSNRSYNEAHPEAKINLSLEDEFWNYHLTGADSNALVTNLGALNPGNVGDKESPDRIGNVIWRKWLAQQIAIRAYAQTNGLSNDFYIGHLNDNVENTTDPEIAAGLVAHTDRIHVSCYLTTANFNKTDGGFKNIKTRLSALGVAALSANKRMDIVVIFANTNEFMASYFATKTPQSAYDKVVASFAKTSFTGKAGIRMAGWNVYKLPTL